MLPGLGEDGRSGYASVEQVSPDGDVSPRPLAPPEAAGCRCQWALRLLGAGVFLALLVLAAAAMDVSEGAGEASSPRLRKASESPDDGGQALLGSVPWFQTVSNGVCEAAEKVLSHPICPTTTTTTTTTMTATTTTLTTTVSTTTSSSTTTATTSTTTTSSTTSTTSTTSTGTTTTTTPHPLWPWPSTEEDTGEKRVVKGISYAPVPLRHAGGVLPDDDFMSSNTSAFWGARTGAGGRGRGDLRVIRALGANAVRLYGNDPRLDHRPFLDEAKQQGLEVVAGLSDYPYVQMPGSCLHTSWDCYEQIKKQYAQNLRNGFLAGPGKYHPALRMVILMNEPDLKFEGGLRGFPGEPKHFCKALISAFDAVLSAEQEAAVEGLAPNFTVAFSFGRCAKCSAFQDQPSLGQMVDLRHAMQNPHSVNYTSRNDLWWAYQRRFVNSFNTQNSASEMRRLFLDSYDQSFTSTPVFIGEYHTPVVPDQRQDLKEILEIAADSSTMLAGISFFEFQVRYDKGGGEMNFGMFGLSQSNMVAEERIASKTYTSWCLTPVRAKSLGQHCGHLQTDVDYVIESTWSQKMDHMPTAELCCNECGKAPKCRAWTWVKDAGLDGCPSQCWLKGSGSVRKEPKSGVVSGLLHSDEEEKVVYVHDALMEAYGGPGVGPELLCPTAPRDTPELLVSASWEGCYARGELEPELAGERQEEGGPFSTSACAKACRRSRYMFVQGDGQCRCGDSHPSKLDCRLERDDECSGKCIDDDGRSTTGYCGDSAHFAVYSIKVSTSQADEQGASS